MVRDILTECDAIAQKRRVGLTIEPFMDSPATPMDAGLIAIFEDTLKTMGIRPLRIASGAGHDAVAMAHVLRSARALDRAPGP